MSTSLPEFELRALMRAEHPDPFSVLGPHDLPDGLCIRALLPGARAVGVVHAASGDPLAILQRRGDSDLFSALVPAAPARMGYRLHVQWDTYAQLIEDPYRFPPVLGDTDVRMFAEGTHLRPWERLGAHLTKMLGVQGTAFAVWAPNAQRVSVVGDFNAWDGRRHMMRLRRECGVWELFAPHVGVGDAYEFEVLSSDGQVLRKADPYARSTRLRPATACVVQPLPEPVPALPTRAAANRRDAPISIYEVHLGSWRRKNGSEWLNYRELADTLVPYAREMGFTHLELLPVTEHPLDSSWGYQPIGLYAPTSRFGTPEDFRHLVKSAQAAGLGVILDWVPAHFPNDAHGLARFDGTALYEDADHREDLPSDGQTLVFNWSRTGVRNYLVGNALYWLERYGIDGLRVNAVAAMLDRDHRSAPGEWVPHFDGVRENLVAVDFLRRMNHVVGTERPSAITFSDGADSLPGVTLPPSAQGGGLGFHFQWNTGWLNDTLAYTQLDPAYRQHHHRAVTRALTGAHAENFVLPFSHDEVVHGKRSMLDKMPGDDWQKFANLRNLYAYQWACPGKKLLFMGNEFGQRQEWRHDRGLDWEALAQAPHAGLQRLVRDLNHVYCHFPALHELDCEPQGFEWLVQDDSQQSILAFLRRANDGSTVVVVCNFSPVVRQNYRLGMPLPGTWRELLNTDQPVYGGSGVSNGLIQTVPEPWHSQRQSARLTVPPLATVMWVMN